MVKRPRLVSTLIRWGFPLGLLLIAAFLRDPFLFAIREPATYGVVLVGLCGLLLVAHRRRPRPPVVRLLLAMLWLAGPTVAIAQRVRFEGQRQSVLAAAGPTAREIGRHFMIGYRDAATVRPLAEAGLIGHVTLTAIDPHHQASQSPAVVQGLLRHDWGFRGLLVTDDFTMGPVYHAGFCASVIRALDAGMDLLLISYDDEQYYPAMACALAARADGRLNPEMTGRTGGIAARAVER